MRVGQGMPGGLSTCGVQHIKDWEKPSAGRDPLSARRGSILIAVLWSLFFLSALALAIYAYIASQMSLVGRLRDRVDARYWAEAGMKRASLEVKVDETQDHDALKEPWSSNEAAFREISVAEGFFSVRYRTAESPDGETYRYGLQDEERRININTASAEVLQRLWTGPGETTGQEAADITDSVLDWIDEDDDPRENGAEKGYYATFQKGYLCPNAKLEAIEELLLVKGMTSEIFEKVKEHLTVYGNGFVNVNTAGKEVLQALGMGGGLAEKVLHFRRGGDHEEATRDDGVFETVETAVSVLQAAVTLSQEELNEFSGIVGGGLVSVESDHFRGGSYGWREDGNFKKEILFVVDRQGRVKYWQEN